MYDLVIDPAYRNNESTTIWVGDYVTSIKGDLATACKEIADRVLVVRETSMGYKTIQVRSVAIDTGGHGRFWMDYLNELGVDVHEIKPKFIDLVLPKLR